MGKLFIQPEMGRGYLKKTIDDLEEAKYEVHLIGYGCPPIYVETDESNYDDVENIAKLVDTDVKFSRYRPDIPDIMDISEWADLISAAELTSKIRQLGNANFIVLCDELDVDRGGLAGNAIGDLGAMAADLVAKHSRARPKLVKAIIALNNDLFQANC